MGAMGTSVLRLEDAALLTGAGRFIDDVPAAGALHVAFLRSPEPHARIRSTDVSAARALPGVRAVLTLDDLAPVMTRRVMMGGSRSSKLPENVIPPALADREVCFVGQPVALVVAESRYIAEDAAALIAVDYEALPVVADCRAAMDDSSPRVQMGAMSNVIASYNVSYGDVDAAFRDAAHVFGDEFWQHRGGGHAIECRGIFVDCRGPDGLTVWASTQKAHELFQVLADLLGLDENRLRVITPDVGGGFGPKLIVYPEDVAVAAAAKLLGVSLKWIEDRREHFLGAVQERDQYWSLEIAVDADARIRAVRGKLLHDLGAYAYQDVNLPYNSATSVAGPYIVPACSMDVAVAQSNKVPVSSVRGAGYPQPAFAMERLMDRVAAELKLDRAEVRRRNMIPAEKMPYEKPLKARSGAPIVYDSGDYPACQAEVLEAAGWDDFPKRQAAARAEGRYIGIGLANAVKGTGRGPFESGMVRISPSGRISIYTGAMAMGQGLCTALAQICADAFGVRAEDVTVVAGDTGMIPFGFGGFASRQLVTAGTSVHLASQAVAGKARKLASAVLKVAEEDLEIADGEARVIAAKQLVLDAKKPRSIGLGELARTLRGAGGSAFPDGMEPGLEASFYWRSDSLAYANACHVVEVEVDVDTGGVRLLRYVAIQDSGRLINPVIVDGQVHGGITHGIGNALFEWMGYDDAAQPVTTTFADYLLPTATELPAFETLYKESPSPLNPLGVKGAGEVGTIPVTAAIMSAIENALTPFNVRINQTPISPERVLELIEQGRGASCR
jgi:aerobic carbon-monoxide dehydrogenase large subunit